MNVLTTCVLIGTITVIGGIAAYSDICIGIVPNRWLLRGVALSIVSQVLSFVLNQGFLLSWVTSFVLAAVVAVLLYAGGLWAAGDAKLFLFLFLCIPQFLIDPGSYIQGIVIYFYIFIPAFCWIVIDTIALTLRNAERFSQSSVSGQQIYGAIGIAIEVCCIEIILQRLFPRFCTDNRMLISVLVLVIGYIISRASYLRRRKTVILFCTIWITLLFGSHVSLDPSMFSTYIVLCVILVAKNWAAGFNYKRINTTDVKPGMILSSGTVLLFKRSRVKGLPSFSSENMDSRLTEEEADAVRRWEKSVFGESTIVIVRKLPFAVFIYSGFMFWMLVRFIGR